MQACLDITGNAGGVWHAARACTATEWEVALTPALMVTVTPHPNCNPNHNHVSGHGRLATSVYITTMTPCCLQNLIKRVYKVYTFLPALKLAGHESLWSAARGLGDGEWAVT